MLYALIFGVGFLAGIIATCAFLALTARPLTTEEAERQMIDLAWDHPNASFTLKRRPHKSSLRLNEAR